MTTAALPAKSILVAHRGDAARYSENSLAAFASATKLGVTHVELDIQLTADGIPIVIHDPTLERSHNLDIVVHATKLAALEKLGVLTGGNRPPHIPRLAEFAAWMQKNPQMHVFVEIKKESLRAQGRERVLAASGREIEALRERATIISYDARVLAMARHRGWAIGYVLATLSARWRGIAERLAPEILFAEFAQLERAGKLWPGAWQWAAFELQDLTTAQRIAALGVRFLETMNPALFKSAARRSGFGK